MLASIFNFVEREYCLFRSILVGKYLSNGARKRCINFPSWQPMQVPKLFKKQRDSSSPKFSPSAQTIKMFHYLGIEITDPSVYESIYGTTLVNASQLPKDVNEFPTPKGEVLADNTRPFLEYNYADNEFYNYQNNYNHYYGSFC